MTSNTSKVKFKTVFAACILFAIITSIFTLPVFTGSVEITAYLLGILILLTLLNILFLSFFFKVFQVKLNLFSFVFSMISLVGINIIWYVSSGSFVTLRLVHIYETMSEYKGNSYYIIGYHVTLLLFLLFYNSLIKVVNRSSV